MKIKTRYERRAELIQRGCAVGIIQHGYNSTQNAMWGLLRSLDDKVAKGGDKELQEVAEAIRETYTTLHTYLGLFDPLNDRLYHRAIEIGGSSIIYYLHAAFNGRAESISQKIVGTTRFLNQKLETYPASILPVFVILVDMAMEFEDGPITLDADDTGFLLPCSFADIRAVDELVAAKSALIAAGHNLTAIKKGTAQWVAKVWYKRSIGKKAALSSAPELMPPKKDSDLQVEAQQIVEAAMAYGYTHIACADDFAMMLRPEDLQNAKIDHKWGRIKATYRKLDPNTKALRAYIVETLKLGWEYYDGQSENLKEIAEAQNG